MTSGCASSVDRETLLQHLHGVTKSYLPYALQHQYWSMVLLGEVRPNNWRQVADKLIKDNQNSLAGIFDSLLPSNIIGGSVGTDGMSALPFTLALNITAQSSIRQPFVNYGSFGEFGIGSPLSSDGTITGRSLNLDESPEAPSSSVSIGNFGSVNPNDPDLHNSLSGFGAPIPSTIQRRNYFGCPYQPIHWPNFPSLEGSFQGCCKRPLCYLPKQAIRKTYSGLAKYDTMWSSWGPCSATCGEGKTKRNRHCVGEGCGGGYEEQIKYCMETPCPTFTPWSQYGPCSVSCGGGTKTRTRSCVGDGPCSGELKEESPCKPGKCPTFRARPGNSWSSCSTTCGVGVQRRNLRCVDPGAYGCPPVKFEEKECNKYCGRVVYNPRTCDPSTCKYTQTPRCVQRNRRPGHCPPDDMKVKTGANCFEGSCICRRFPHFCPRRPSTGSGNRNSLFDLQ
ncbi:uncharacterized protein LOC143468247 [Clavelina lepadiformis]|uniref:Uncharacterized protein n=1 Tax=Clavelina lepadiformis TaxID=159417 RepID=A0ABP0G6V7_CLALP